MFKKITDFAYRRTALEALGFYLAYFLLGGLLGALIGGLAAAIKGDATFASSYITGASVGQVVAIIFCLIIAILVVKAKNGFKNFSYILLIVLSGLLAVFGGNLVGLIPVAYLTTR